MNINKKYKYLDVGCKNGGSFLWGKKYGYHTDEGLGVDIDKDRVLNFKKMGYDGIVCSATKIPFPDKSFELVILNHVIEHLPDERMGRKAFRECLRVSKNFFLLGLPFFDEDQYINSLGFKTFYSDWDGHTNMLHLSKIKDIYLKDFKYKITMVKKIEDTNAPEILPISAPRNSASYDKKIHGPKEYVKFDREIYREYLIEIKI